MLLGWFSLVTSITFETYSDQRRVPSVVSAAIYRLYPLDLCASGRSGLAGWLRNKLKGNSEYCGSPAFTTIFILKSLRPNAYV